MYVTSNVLAMKCENILLNYQHKHQYVITLIEHAIKLYMSQVRCEYKCQVSMVLLKSL